MVFSQEQMEQMAIAPVYVTKQEASQNPIMHKDMRDIAASCGETVLNENEYSNVPFENKVVKAGERIVAGHTFTYFNGNVTNQEPYQNAVLIISSVKPGIIETLKIE